MMPPPVPAIAATMDAGHRRKENKQPLLHLSEIMSLRFTR